MLNIKKISIHILFGIIGLSLVACQEDKKPQAPKALNEQERSVQKKKQEEEQAKNNALHRQMFIETQGVELAAFNDSTLAVRSMIAINRIPKIILFSMSLMSSPNGNGEQFSIQDKSEEIKSQFPNYNLEVSGYKFKSGNVDMLALEYRLMRLTQDTNEAASQFVLVILDKTLGNKNIVKTSFEFPSQSDLKTWATAANSSVMETP
jgi:hypothetical protein